MDRSLSTTRRHFLASGAAAFALPLVPTFGARHRPPQRRFRADPFQLGVASGDPDERGVVLWTRLAPEPLDPGGGLPPEPVDVVWEVFADEALRRRIARGTTRALPELAHSVHVEVDGLDPDRWYWFRFRAGDATSPVGRTRTLPPAHAAPERLRFAVASCQQYEQGLYTAYEHLAAQDFDLVVFLGDYIYEREGQDGFVRKHLGGNLSTLEDYRQRYALYRSDPLLQRAHAHCPWLPTFDDHEVENNYAGAISERKDADPEQFLAQRAAAYRAYYEAMPLRRRSLPTGPDMLLHRQIGFGRLLRFFVLDTRQYRTGQPNDGGRKPLNEAARNPANTMLGSAQKQWLLDGLAASPASWNVLAQQVMMAMVGYPPKKKKKKKQQQQDGELRFSMDQWPGYAHERAELLRFLTSRRVANPVVLTGDIHSSWVNDLRVDDRDAGAPIVATEFVATSISSGGDGGDAGAELATLQKLNPGLRFLDRRRGYLACTVTPARWTAEFWTVDQVTRPGGEVSRRAAFHLAAGAPGAVSG